MGLYRGLLGRPGEGSTFVLTLTLLTIPTAQPSCDKLPGAPEGAKVLADINKAVS